MLLEVFGRLEAVGQFFAQGLLDHPTAGKADQGLGLGQDQVAEHGEAGRDAARGGVGEQGDVKQFGLAVALQGAGDLGHLHQAEHAFLHARPARGADNQHRQALGRGGLDQAGEFLAHHRAHRAAHEAEIHGPDRQGQAFNAADAGAHRILEAAGLLGVADAVGVAAAILEAERIGGGELQVEGLEAAGIGDQGNAGGGINAVVVAAVAAHARIGDQVLAIHHQGAFGAFAPEAVVLTGLLAGAHQRGVLAAIGKPVEQRHGASRKRQWVDGQALPGSGVAVVTSLKASAFQ